MSSRLTDSQKKDLLEGFSSGKPTSVLATAYGCSQNTVTRTVKTLLSEKEYKALKIARSKRADRIKPSVKSELSTFNESKPEEALEQPIEKKGSAQGRSSFDSLDEPNADAIDGNEESSGPLALDDADDFSKELDEEIVDEDLLELDLEDSSFFEVFQEIVPLTDEIPLEEQRDVPCKKLSPGLLPESVYLVVDKTVELETRQLSEFPELGFLKEEDQARKALCLFANQRSAKRHCGRSQRVIKVPDTAVFELSAPFLLSRGITRLVLEGSLISLDL